jgi:hypothetical protein
MTVNVYILRENIILGSFIVTLCSGPRKRSQYSNSLQAGRSGSRILGEGGGGDFPYPFTPALGPTKPLYNVYRISFPGGKAAGTWR